MQLGSSGSHASWMGRGAACRAGGCKSATSCAWASELDADTIRAMKVAKRGRQGMQTQLARRESLTLPAKIECAEPPKPVLCSQPERRVNNRLLEKGMLLVSGG